MTTLNIAIIGAGLAGRLLAHQLSRHSHSVSLFEANKINSALNVASLSAAAFTAAGMIAPISETLESDLDTFDLGKTSLLLWPTIIQQLEASCKENLYYQHNGSLIVCHPQDTAELTHFRRRVINLAATCDAQYQDLSTAQIQQLEPDLGNGFNDGMLLPDEANIDNRHLMAMLLKASINQGTTLIDNTTVQVQNNAVHHAKGSETFDWVFDCRGLGAKAQLGNLRGVRGEVLRVHCPEVKLSRPVRLMHPRYQLYLCPKPNDQYVIGATQIESEDVSPISVQSMLELCSAMYSLNPAFAEARIIEQSTNLRPALTDNRAQVLVQDKHVSINGLFRHGYLVAPAIVNSVIQWLAGNQCEHHHTLFSISEQTSA